MTQHDASPAQGALPYRWVVLGVLSAAYCLVFVQRMCPAVLAPAMMEDFQASSALLGLLASSYFYTYALMQLPGGILSDRLGTRRLVTAALSFATVGGLVFAFAPSASVAFAGRMAVGLGLALVLVPTYRALAYWFSSRDYVFACSLVIAASGLGSLLAGAPLGTAAAAMGWRGAMAGVAALTLIFAVLVWVLVRDMPPGVEPEKPEPSADSQESDSLLNSLRMVVRDGGVWLLALWFLINGGVMFSFVGLWAGPYFMDGCGFSVEQAGLLISIIGVGNLVGPLAGGVLGRIIPSRKLILAGGMVPPSLLFLWAALRNGAMGMAEMSVWGFVLAFCMGGVPALLFTAAKERLPLRLAGTVSGFVYLFPMLGAAAYQLLVGLILDSGRVEGQALHAESFLPMLLFYSASCAVAMVSILFLREKKVN